MFAGTWHNGSEHASQGPAPTGARSALRPAASAVGLGANRSSYAGQRLPMGVEGFQRAGPDHR